MNKVILIGRIGKDVELIDFEDSCHKKASFSVATSTYYKAKSGDKQEKTDWHNIVCWNKTAEIADKYLKKGDQVGIEGEINTRSYEDKDGNIRYVTEIKADRIELLGSKKD